MKRDIPKAFVLNMYCTGLGIARNLGKYGIPVVGISNNNFAPGNFSRYCDGLVGPDLQKEPEKMLDFLISVGKSESRQGILFPTSDFDINFINNYRDTLEKYFVLPQPSHEELDLIFNKYRLTETAAYYGIPTPWALKVSSIRELEKNKNNLTFPLVAKAIYSNQWRLPGPSAVVGYRKGFIFHNFKDLMKFYKRIAVYQRDLLLQEWVSGKDSNYFVMGTYFNRKSECLGAFTAKKTLQFPPDIGLGCIYKTIKNNEILSLGKKLLNALKFKGLAELEFKFDKDSHEYKLIEINPRHWDQHFLGTFCGVNLSYLAYKDLCLGINPIEINQNSEDVYWIRGDGLIGSIKDDIRKRKISISKIIHVIPARRKVYSIWNKKDPIPFAINFFGKILEFINFK